MDHGYILITSGKSKLTGAKVARKPRKSRPKTGRTIELVDALTSSTNNGASPDLAAELRAPSVSAASRRERASAAETALPIDYGETLKACMTVEEVREWFVRQQVTFNDKVARGFGRRKMSDESRAKAEAVLNGVGTTTAFLMIDDYLARVAFEKLHRHLIDYVAADPANELALVTFITRDGGTSMDRPVIEVRKSRKFVNDTMRKMAPHWFGAIDLAFFWTINHPDGGLHLQRHEHALAWGRQFIAKAEGVAAAQSAKLPANVTNLPVIKVVRAWDTSEVNMARLAAYLLKAPAKAKNWFEYPNGKEIMNHTEAKDRYIQFLRLAQLRTLLSFEDVIFGGGDGVKIKGSLIDDMRDLASTAARGKAIMHPDEVSTFWAGFNRELGQDHWAVPAILRR